VLKVVIVILLIAIIASLFSGAVFFFKDQGNERKRTMYALGIRVTLAVLLMICIIYGIASGQLTPSAPWYNP
jgi:formate hydrogenlyase subunit 3/multisubunit Na+/H+ antiporter MnhD subunit